MKLCKICRFNFNDIAYHLSKQFQILKEYNFLKLALSTKLHSLLLKLVDLRMQNCLNSHTCLCSTAEEYQKLAFPTSVFVWEGILTAHEYEVWTPIPHIVELLFNCGRNG